MISSGAELLDIESNELLSEDVPEATRLGACDHEDLNLAIIVWRATQNSYDPVDNIPPLSPQKYHAMQQDP